jgi:hypothetical protein
MKYNEEQIIGQLREFLTSSEYFNGITMTGCYNMNLNVFLFCFKGHLNGEKGLLDDHATLEHLSWEIDKPENWKFRGMDNNDYANFLRIKKDDNFKIPDRIIDYVQTIHENYKKWSKKK